MEKSRRKSPALKEMMNEQRMDNNKMKLRKQKIQEAISQNCMKDTNPIADYNLSAHQKKKKKNIIRCCKCGKNGHTKNFFPSIKIFQIQRFAWEMKKRIETLEKALSLSIKKAKNQRENIRPK